MQLCTQQIGDLWLAEWFFSYIAVTFTVTEGEERAFTQV